MYTLITKSESIPDNFTGVVEHSNGTTYYYFEGKCHRLDGPAVEYTNGRKEYYVEDKLHRLDGPAIECSNGTKEYWVEGEPHRLDGPAVEYTNGRKEYWVEGERLSEEDFLSRTTKNCSKDLSGLTVEIEGKKYSLKAVD